MARFTDEKIALAKRTKIRPENFRGGPGEYTLLRNDDRYRCYLYSDFENFVIEKISENICDHLDETNFDLFTDYVYDNDDIHDALNNELSELYKEQYKSYASARAKEYDREFANKLVKYLYEDCGDNKLALYDRDFVEVDEDEYDYKSCLVPLDELIDRYTSYQMDDEDFF